MSKVKFFSYHPRVYGIIYVLFIPSFALIYCFLPSNQFDTSLSTTNFITWLYFSTITITTLGFGDISPVSIWSQGITMIESLSGIVLIGMFLNSIAQLKSSLDLAEEKLKNQELVYNQAKSKLLRFNKLVEINIKYYILYVIIVTNPIGSYHRRKGILKKKIKFNDLRDLYQPTLQSQNEDYKPAINYYFEHQKNLLESIDSMLKNIDFTFWPKLSEICLDFISGCKELDFSEFILSQPKMRMDNKRMDDYYAERIKEFSGAVEFRESSGMNAYIALFKLINQNLLFLDTYKSIINDLDGNRVDK